MSKRRHNFGTKRFKEKSLFIFHARIALKSLILLFVRLIARGARIGKHTHTQTDTQDKYCNPRACAPRVNNYEQVPSAHCFLRILHTVHIITQTRYIKLVVITAIRPKNIHTTRVSKVAYKKCGLGG